MTYVYFICDASFLFSFQLIISGAYHVQSVLNCIMKLSVCVASGFMSGSVVIGCAAKTMQKKTSELTLCISVAYSSPSKQDQWLCQPP